MSDQSQALALLTSVRPFAGSDFCDAGGLHAMTQTNPPVDCLAVLAGVDVWVQPNIASVGQCYMEYGSTGYAFWAGGFNIQDFPLGPNEGTYLSYRGGVIIGYGDEIHFGYNSVVGPGSGVNFAYWGYYIPFGWSPVGVTPQQ